MNELTADQAWALINATKGRLFGASFIKRETGEEREMTARTGVTAYLKGGVLSYNPDNYYLVSVFDVVERGYRMIPVDGLLELRYAGKVWPVEQFRGEEQG